MAQTLITDYLVERSSIYAELHKQREEGWANSEADKYFQYMQKSADEASLQTRKYFMQIMQEIAREMDQSTQFLTDLNTHKQWNIRSPPPKVLDLCMAPGGFSAVVRDCLCPLTEICGITLPPSHGGHELLIELGPRLHVEFVDITMLAEEMGSTDIPTDHPDHNSFSFERPYLGYKFDLILCDGQVLRTHKRQDYRDKIEAWRLSASQLIFALQHIKIGGTFVMLLHKSEAWSVMKLIHTFKKISDNVQLFKPHKWHAIRSSFYIVAKGVNPQAPAALRAVKEWKDIWVSTTFHFSIWNQTDPSDDEVKNLLEDFGETFVKICEPLWQIQSKALQRKLKNGFLVL